MNKSIKVFLSVSLLSGCTINQYTSPSPVSSPTPVYNPPTVTQPEIKKPQVIPARQTEWYKLCDRVIDLDSENSQFYCTYKFEEHPDKLYTGLQIVITSIPVFIKYKENIIKASILPYCLWGNSQLKDYDRPLVNTVLIVTYDTNEYKYYDCETQNETPWKVKQIQDERI